MTGPTTPLDRFPQLIRRKFKPAEIERITGVTPENVRQWRSRGIVDYHDLINIDLSRPDPDPTVRPLMPHGLNTANWAWMSKLAVIRHLQGIGIEVSRGARLATALELHGFFNRDWTNKDEEPHDLFVMVASEADWDKPSCCSARDLQSNDPPRAAVFLNLADLQRAMFARLGEILANE